MTVKTPSTSIDFTVLLADVKQRIQTAQTRAVLAVNSELVRLYWDIGRLIDQRQAQEGWGAGVIPRLAAELKNELPEVKGFSERNIKRMLAFYRKYSAPDLIVPQPVAQLSTPAIVQPPVAQFPEEMFFAVPWAHHVILMQKVKDLPSRRWYMEQMPQPRWHSKLNLIGFYSQSPKVNSNYQSRLGRIQNTNK